MSRRAGSDSFPEAEGAGQQVVDRVLLDLPVGSEQVDAGLLVGELEDALAAAAAGCARVEFVVTARDADGREGVFPSGGVERPAQYAVGRSPEPALRWSSSSIACSMRADHGPTAARTSPTGLRAI